jgi:hypothetical protein
MTRKASLVHGVGINHDCRSSFRNASLISQEILGIVGPMIQTNGFVGHLAACGRLTARLFVDARVSYLLFGGIRRHMTNRMEFQRHINNEGCE